jgi:membrane peptidoglycan carboxypeptidase
MGFLLRGIGRLLLALLLSLVLGAVMFGAALPVVAGGGLAVKDRLDDYLVLPTDLAVPALPQRSRMLAADGSLIAWLYLENRVRVDRLSDVPQHVRDAVVAIEDSRFYDHRGVDVKGSVRAAVRNSLSGEVEQGGSTLTQQYVKNALLAAASSDEERNAATEVSLERKLREARYALALERSLSKDDILLRYLNIAYYGNGAHGLGTAADFYFTRSVRTLTLAQGALLAGIVQSPARLDPVDHPEAALARRNVVLARMAEVGSLTEAEATAAAAEPLGLVLRDIRSGCEAPGVPAPYFCDYVRRALEDGPLGATLGATREERQQRLLGGGLTIQTTLDNRVQVHAQKVVTERIGADDPSGVAATFTAVEPGTGQVKAMVVNRRYGETGQQGSTKVNLAIGGSSGMQAGSTFKPFVLAAAVQQGLPLDTTVDAPATYTSPVFEDCARGVCKPYAVSNAGDSNAGRHDVVSATHGSVNTAYLQFLERTGVERPAAIAESLGLRQFQVGAPSGPLHRGGSFVLGANEVSPLALTAAYAAFAARGTYCPPTPVVQVLDAGGQQVPLQQQPCTQALEPRVADTVTSVLRGTIDGPAPFRTARRADIGRPAAGKTGSTNSSRAAWFAGYTPQLAGTVWVGRPVPSPLQDITVGGQYFSQVYGGTLPAPIWRDVVGPVLRGTPVAPLPPPAVSRPQPAEPQGRGGDATAVTRTR